MKRVRTLLAPRRVRADDFAASPRRKSAAGRSSTRSSSRCVADPQLSPDGKQILVHDRQGDWKANRRIGHIYRINSDGTSQVQLTFGERGESSPRWSPDGKSIAFTARRDPDTDNQIYLLTPKAAKRARITNHATATGNLTWAPDGKSIYFAATDAKSAEERERDRVSGRCVCVRGEQLQAAPPVDHGSRGQDETRSPKATGRSAVTS